MKDTPDREADVVEETPAGRPVAPPANTPAEEWGQREDSARTVAAGGKESEKAAPDRPQE